MVPNLFATELHKGTYDVIQADSSLHVYCSPEHYQLQILLSNFATAALITLNSKQSAPAATVLC